MNTNRIIILINFFFFITIFYSCSNNTNNENKRMEYYENGIIKSETQMKNGLKHGLEVQYKKNGEVLYRLMWFKGVENGRFERYRNDGLGIDHTLTYKDGKKFRYKVEYIWDNQLYAIVHYVDIGKEVIVNQYLNFDPFGNIDKKISNYYSVIQEKDTIAVNEACKYEVYLDAPFFRDGYMKVVIGDYNNLFELTDSASLDTIKADGWHASIEKKFPQKGEQFLRGKILNIKETGFKVEVREMYFEGVFTVK